MSPEVHPDPQPAQTPPPLQAGTGKCTHSGCSCPSFVDPPGGFDCARCGHPRSDHW